MIFSQKTKVYLIGGLPLIAILIFLPLIGEIILPFVFGIFIAYMVNPTILNIQKKIKNRALAVTAFTLSFFMLLFGIITFFGEHIVEDSKRFVDAVDIFIDQNEQQISKIQNNIGHFVNNVYQNKAVQEQIATVDTLTFSGQKKNIMSALEALYSFFVPSNTKPITPQPASWSIFYMLIYTILYTLMILYTYTYFENKYIKYFVTNKHTKKDSYEIWRDFKIVFLNYFRQRAKVVLISMLIFISAFSLINLPGAIIIGIIAGVLCYASHFHFLTLPLTAVGSWVLSIEHDLSFFLFFGIILIVYILVSILEETIFFDKIMKSVNGMNPAIMILAFALWCYIFGGFIGTIIALPLTQLILIYIDRLLLHSLGDPPPLDSYPHNNESSKG